MAPPSGFAALANREDRLIGRFCLLITYLLQFLFVTSVRTAVCNSGYYVSEF